jgi:WD40 repeat protein/TPR repeat protein
MGDQNDKTAPRVDGRDPAATYARAAAEATQARVPAAIGSIELRREIGVGGMAVVYEGLDVGFSPPRRVAVKLMDPRLSADADFRARFEREASLVAEFRHDNIVHVYASGEAQGAKYLVMEYLAGGTLAEGIAAGPLRVSEAIQIATALADALSYSHARGVVHRDFKPGNVLITADGKPVLSDFGIAKPTLATEAALTQGPIVMGAPRYMAPEQGLAQRVTDRADIYSFGLTLIEMLTGRLPDASERVLYDTHKGADGIRALLEPISPVIAQLVCQCLLLDPTERPTALECARTLRGISIGAATVTQARRTVRVFVTSPSDVSSAREVAAQIIEKLAQEHARFFTLETYLWDFEVMLASAQLEDPIDLPRRFDAVVVIIGSRLGPPLPARTDKRDYRSIDGRAQLSGTEWVLDDALIGARERGAPRVLIYRSQSDAALSTSDSESRDTQLRQVEALEVFWAQSARTSGSFAGNCAQFLSLAEFGPLIEADLRRCVERWVEDLDPIERASSARLWAKAPFRGLESYEFEHTQIFFGRDEEIGTALLRLIGNAQAGRPFLLVLGSSGSGKSSFVKAGIVPRLLAPQRVPGVAFVRRVIFRPSDALGDEDLFDALARRLTQIEGESTGLPELLGSSMPVAELAQYLRESSSHPHLPLTLVLDRLAETARAEGKMLRYEQPALLLIVDQLEELFTRERVRPEERARFVQLLAGLVRSGRIWIVATMRADFWHRAADTPELVHLADGEARLDLLPASPAELSRMIRGPAEAAAIRFETHSSTGIPLNDVIAEVAANEPGVLPLLSYLLDQLYQRDIKQGGGDTLTYGSYEALGGLKGAIAKRADAVLEALPQEVRQALRPVLFALVQTSAGESRIERAVARRAPLSDFPEGSPKHRLILALVDPGARLVVAETAGGTVSTVRLAHEALISEWQTAREYVAGNAEALKTRRTVEERFARWQALNESELVAAGRSGRRFGSFALRRLFAPEHGLLRDVDLSDARRLLRDYREELSAELVGYIERSRERDRRRRMRMVRAVAAVAIVTSVFAAAAGYGLKVALSQRDNAFQAQLRLLTQTAAARLNDRDVAGATAISLEVLTNRSSTQRYNPDALNVFEEARGADAQVLALTPHAGWVRSAAFSPDGRRLATALGDKTAWLWDAASGEQLLALRGHTDQVRSVAFSPEGQRIVTASFDKTARLWDATSGRPLLVLMGHTDRLESATFSPDGRSVVTASRDKTARLWDATTGRQLLVLGGDTDGMTSATFSPDGTRVVTGSYDKTARLWDAKTGRQLLVLKGHTERVVGAAFSPEGQRIVTASLDKTARLWDAIGGQPLGVLSAHTDVVESAEFSPDGKRILTASFDKTARLWDATSGQPLGVLSGHADAVLGAVFSPDGRHIVTASMDRTARLWDATLSPSLLVLAAHTDAVVSAAFSPDGRRIVTGSLDRTGRVWDAMSGQQLLVLNGHTDTVASAMFSPDGRRIVTASYDKTARLWDATSGRQLLVLEGHTERVADAAFSPNGERIVTAAGDKTARLWDAASGQQLVVLSGHTDSLVSAAFSLDGRRIVTASFDKTAQVWDAISGQRLLVLTGHQNAVEGAAFSPDGRRIVTASDDKTVRLWDATSGQQLVVLSPHTDAVESVAFSPDGRRIVTTSFDRTARILDVHTNSLQSQLSWAQAAQFDPLTAEERFALGLPAASGIRRWSQGATPCDRAAAAIYDPDRRAPGVVEEDLVADVAKSACTVGNAKNPDAPLRDAYQHGRALMAAGDFAAARLDFEHAVAGGYRAAQIDLARHLVRGAADEPDVKRAIALDQRAWADGVLIAAFELGNLYERGVHAGASVSAYALNPDEALAWSWYQRGAAAGEPSALARLAEREDRAALNIAGSGERDARWLQALRYLAAACERARQEDWPAGAWLEWRYRRASLARLLERDGMMEQVAQTYDAVIKQYAAPRTVPRWLTSLGGLTD